MPDHPAPGEREQGRRFLARSQECRTYGARTALGTQPDLALTAQGLSPPPPEMGAAGGPAPAFAQHHPLTQWGSSRAGGRGSCSGPRPRTPGSWGSIQGQGPLGKPLSTLRPLPHFEMAASRVPGAVEQRWGRERKCHPLQSGDGDVTATVSL